MESLAVGYARFKMPASGGTEGMIFQKRNERDATMIFFDVVCISREKREVRFVRFGAGDDRVIRY